MTHIKYSTADKQNHMTFLWANAGPSSFTNRNDMYMKYLKTALPSFNGGKVLEVGPGDGTFAVMMHREYDISNYTILDLEKNMDYTKQNLTRNNISAHHVCTQNYETLFSEEYDIFISNVCLSETPFDYCESLLNNILPYCENAFIIDGDPHYPGFNDFLISSIRTHFRRGVVYTTEYNKCSALGGFNTNKEINT